MKNIFKTTGIAITIFFGSTVFGHVFLIAPTGDDVLKEGSTYAVTWQITIPHDTENWDLYYSVTGQNGKWAPIALNIPVGDNTQGAIHTFDWVVPNEISNDAWVRIVQDNTSGDYDDTNDVAFSIISTPACEGDINEDGNVNVTDLLAVIEAWSQLKSPADVNDDGTVDVSDLLLIVANWGECG